MTNFWDTSALFRRYVPEPGADRVRQTCERAARNTQLISRLLVVEVASAFAMKFRTGFLTAIERDTLWELFETDQAQQYVILELEEAIWPAAQRLLFQYPLKASDALHIALALVAQRRGAGADLHFWTADQQQARAAEAEGLTVELLA